MSELSTNFTEALKKTKSELDSLFRIPVKEDAMRIIFEMERCLTDENEWEAIGDEQIKLIKILENVPEYVKDNHTVDNDGNIHAKALLDSFRNKDDNEEAIKKYKEYVEKMKSVLDINEEYDTIFLDKLNTIHTEYKSSVDYMTRLVKRLLEYNFGYKKAQNDTTRVLILKQFIRQFGYNCVKELTCPELEEYVKTKCSGDFEKITDEVFDLLPDSKGKDTAKNELKATYDDDYINIITKLQDTIVLKAHLIKIDSKQRKEICSIMNENIISDKALKAEECLLSECLLSECFSKPYYKIQLEDFKNYDGIKDLKKFKELYKNLNKNFKLCDSQYEKYSVLFRIFVIMKELADKIPENSKISKLLKQAFPDITFLEPINSKKLVDFIDEKIVDSRIAVLSEDYYLNNKEAMDAFLNCIEENILKSKKNIEQYNGILFERLKTRYNNKSKKGGTDFEINRKKLFKISGQDKTEYDYKLLEISNNLANAKFSSQKKTKEYLYIFAIAFDIRKLPRANPKRIDDIEKNLFFDYYADNIVNNLSSIEENNDNSNTMIDGYGINYKNFAEVIFLWSLEQNKMSAGERLKACYEIIEYCKKNGKTKDQLDKEKSKSKDTDFNTKFYCDKFSVIKNLSKDKLKEYIINEYVCRSNNQNIMQISSNPITAAKIVKEQEKVVNKLLEKINEEMIHDKKQYRKDLIDDFKFESDVCDFFLETEYFKRKCNNCEMSTEKFPYCKEYFNHCNTLFTDYKNRLGQNMEYNCISCCLFFPENSLDDGKCPICDERVYINTMTVDDLLYIKVNEKLKGLDPFKEFLKSFSKVTDLCSENQTQLRDLLYRIQKRLKLDSNTEIHFKNVSRSTIIALCFYEFVLINWRKRLSNNPPVWGSFEEFYNNFCNGGTYSYKIDDESEKLENYKNKDYENLDELLTDGQMETKTFIGANERLEAAGYQKINSKNIFDIYVIFLAYRDNYSPMYVSHTDKLFDFYKKTHKEHERIKEEVMKNK